MEAGARNERGPFRPFGVAVSSSRDAIYVADPDGAALLRFDLAGGDPRKVACAATSWNAPMAVAVTPAGAVLVADAGAATVVVISPGGSCTPLGTGALTRPTGVAFAGGRVFVADPPRHEVVVFATDGTLVARYGEGGTGNVRFHYPSAIEAAADGTLLAVDVLNFRVARLSPEGGSKGAVGGPDTLRRPKGVATGADGRVYVSDADLDAVLVFGPDGAFEYAIGEQGSGAGQLAAPAGLAVSGRHLFVADSLNGRIVIYEILGGSS